MKEQNFSNHSRLVPMFHFVLMPLLLVGLIGSIINIVKSASDGTAFYAATLVTLLFVALIVGSFYARLFALKAQDRAIRAEQNFRHYVATGKTLPIGLRMGQIIALRFAGDDEFIALCSKAETEKLSPKQIKQSIKNWKGDYYRV
ncbi:MAG: hypothetical protein RLY16_2659 [Bacteroidota bacterium]|jgi:L-cystine uptake protein TcyP (sodium:dicarboxylate symporter family)